MKKPWLIGLASIVPGLGFWMLRQRQRAVTTLILFAVALGAYYFFQRLAVSNVLTDFSRYVFWFIWLGQAYFAADTANLVAQREKFPVNAAKPAHKDKTPYSGNQHIDKAQQRAYQAVMPQLQQGETLTTAVWGAYLAERKPGIHIQFPLRNRYLGVTDKDLLIIEADFLGVPMTVERLPFSRVDVAELREVLGLDEIALRIHGGRDVYLQVSPRLGIDSNKIIQAVKAR